ncbi:hypothetical protein [Tenacibaculum ovolyticum]|uniref:hypothetical protein n=1 Tax=Tenacibaculum ovolyticum TaxID=104270 RepID=UPI0007ECD574|nr:hypothetical protein [Tenacibaculum ovolyticum]
MKTVNYNLYKRGYPIDDVKIIFYDANGDQLKVWTFKDAPVVYYQFKFDANGGGLIVEMVISPAIQNYGCKLHRIWHITPIEEEGYKSPVQATEKKEQCFVEEIKIENLDEGSKNGGSNKKLGIIYGKEYRLKVSKYKNNKLPNDNKTVKWSYSYTSAEGVATIGNIKQTGGIITFKTDNLDFCGNNITFYAYIKNKENEASLDVFHHYRFRWFDKEVFDDEIKERTVSKMPWKINQSSTSLCGMACIFYLFAKEQPNEFKTFSEELFRTGETVFNGYSVTPSEEILNKNPKDSDFPEYFNYNTKLYLDMPFVDYITMVSVRNADNLNYKGGNEQFEAINWPPLMTGLLENMLGYKTVESSGIYNPIKRTFTGASNIETQNKIDNLNKLYNEGYKLILMIDSDLIAQDEDTLKNIGQLEYHWVVLESKIQNIQNLDTKGNIFYKYYFNVYSWGSKTKYIKKSITWQDFAHNYYGYIKVK